MNDTRAALHREFVCECLRIAVLKCSHAADNLAIDDTVCAERDIHVAVSHLREAAKAFREMVGTPIKK